MSNYFMSGNAYLVKVKGCNNGYIMIGEKKPSGHPSNVGHITTIAPESVQPATGELRSRWSTTHYPRLCRPATRTVGVDSYIVLFTSNTHGTVISHDENSPNQTGQHSTTWVTASDTSTWETISALDLKFTEEPKISLMTSVNVVEAPERVFPLFALGYIPSAPTQTYVVMFTDETTGTVVQSPEPLGTNYGPLTHLNNLKLSDFSILPLGTTITLSLG